MSGDKDTLLDFSAIEKNLDSVVRVARGVRPIPIAGIVGSLGRYQEFTENFLPQAGRVSEKFESVKAAMLSGKVLPPIKVYQVLDSFFVIDGHHRVTVAKNELKAVDIDAEVVEIEFGLSLSPEKKYAHDNQAARRFLIKVEERAFERETHLKNGILVRPLEVTELTSYAKLYEEIAHFRRGCAGGGLAKKNVVFASLLWYESRFLPAARIILDQGLLEGFPARTYTDLYIWIQQHKYYLSQKAGFDVGFDFTKEDFVRKFRKAKFYDLLPSLFQGIAGFIKQQRPTA
ncbi:MAG: ParB N-terminal domain-containing protein [Elusimicrobia bacterium]|nr:ParB N-terminal domain-containing protein [Elusimicrobiota bacterium]